MILGHFSTFLANFQLSRVDISKRKILPNDPTQNQKIYKIDAVKKINGPSLPS